MKKLQLILTNPCSENWDEMQPDKAGRYCESCAKHIVDLTAKSDKELIDFFKKKKDNLCGRLLSTQLDRELIKPPQKSNWYWLFPIALGTSVFMPSKSKGITPIIVQNNNILFRDFSIIKSLSNNVTILDTIQGKILDENTNKPLVGVKIKTKGSNNVIAITDSLGNFKLSLTENEKTTTLFFELTGYIIVEKSITDDMIVKLKKELRIMLGAVSIKSTSNKPLYIITNGKKSYIADVKQSEKINPDWIEKIDILKDANATALYGSKAANGVILMRIKKKFANKVNFLKK